MRSVVYRSCIFDALVTNSRRGQADTMYNIHKAVFITTECLRHQVGGGVRRTVHWSSYAGRQRRQSSWRHLRLMADAAASTESYQRSPATAVISTRIATRNGRKQQQKDTDRRIDRQRRIGPHNSGRGQASGPYNLLACGRRSVEERGL